MAKDTMMSARTAMEIWIQEKYVHADRRKNRKQTEL